jgi:hypothetical protein
MSKSNMISIFAFIMFAVGLFTYNVLHTTEDHSIVEAKKEPVEELLFIYNEEDELVEQMTVPVEDEFPFDMTESDVLGAIHALSHQKVQAEVKWSFMLITTERIERLIEVVEANNYDHSDGYLDILYRWNEGDFSQAHHDHNFVWKLQGGTVGKATGLLSPEEEQAYIQEQMPVAEPEIDETNEGTR